MLLGPRSEIMSDLSQISLLTHEAMSSGRRTVSHLSRCFIVFFFDIMDFFLLAG